MPVLLPDKARRASLRYIHQNLFLYRENSDAAALANAVGRMFQDTEFMRYVQNNPTLRKPMQKPSDMQAMAWALPLLRDKFHAVDAQLTTLMANVYDRDVSAEVLTQAVMKFSKQNLRMNARTNEKLNRLKLLARTPLEVKTKRPRVALISPLFCASPVYFLTILVSFY